MKHLLLLRCLIVVFMSGLGLPALAQTKSAALDRTVLPIPEPKRPLYKELDARNIKAPDDGTVLCGVVEVAITPSRNRGGGVRDRLDDSRGIVAVAALAAAVAAAASTADEDDNDGVDYDE